MVLRLFGAKAARCMRPMASRTCARGRSSADTAPAISGTCLPGSPGWAVPGGPGQRHKRHTGPGAGRHGIAAHLHGKGMGGVDHMADPVLRQIAAPDRRSRQSRRPDCGRAGAAGAPRDPQRTRCRPGPARPPLARARSPRSYRRGSTGWAPWLRLRQNG